MIPYRFLSPAEEEMTEAALFYETALVGLGTDFLNDVQRVVNRVLDYPQIGQPICGSQTYIATSLSVQPHLHHF